MNTLEINLEAPLISQEGDDKKRTKSGPSGTQLTRWIWQEIQEERMFL